jgi:hydrogenase/urease accessory protein HupE
VINHRPTRAPYRAAVPLATTAALVMTAAPAQAHGIGGDAADRSILGFVPLGIEHMLLGWDHLLFIAAIVLVARDAKLAAKMITLFVVGHSTTLIVAVLAGWRVNPGAVDAVIALSVVVVAGVGIIGRPERFRLFGAMVLGFGLVHGLGLATRFQDLGIPPEGRIWKVIAFNFGIEIGQLTAIFAMAVVVLLAPTYLDPDKFPRIAQLVCAPIFIGGSVAAALIAFNTFTEIPEPGQVTMPADSSCSVTSPTRPLTDEMGVHPPKAFYEPAEQTPFADFNHVLGDGYVIVLYPESIAATDLDRLRSFVTGPQGEGVLAGPAAGGTTEIKAFQARHTLSCGDVELDHVEAFSGAWLDAVR